MNKNDIKIMYYLYNQKCNTEIQSYTVTKIAKGVNLSKPKIRYTVKMLVELEYLGRGFQDAHSNTYYISKKGIDFLKGVR